MVLKRFQIVFDNPWATYYSGQPVTGRVLLDVDSAKKIRGLVIHFKGEANVKWDETKAKQNTEGTTVNETTVHTAQEQYFENKFNLLGGGSNEVYIQPGEQSYPFSTFLPPNLPSSFEGEFGHVRYTVKATLDRPWKFDQDVKAAFTVISPVDLNTHETAKNPVKIENEKFFCCCCCKSGPFTMVLSLPVSGYVSGQAIPVTVEADNTSNVEITAVKCILRKIVTFRAKFPAAVKKDKITIAEHVFGGVEPNGSHTWTELLVIPPLPPSNLQNCNIIDLDYDLKIQAQTSRIGLQHGLTIKAPITVGTVPLLSYQPPVPVPKPAELNGGDKDPNAGVTNPQQPQWGPNMPPGGQPQGDPNVPTGQPIAYPQQPQWGPNVPPGGQPQGDTNIPAGQPAAYPQQPQWGPNLPPGGQPQGDPNVVPTGQPAAYPQQPQWGPNFPPGGQPQINPTVSPTGQPMTYPQQPHWNGPPQGDLNVPGAGHPQLAPSAPGGNALYPTIPPPTFAEYTFGAKNIQDANDTQYTQGNMQFAPRYPVYNFQPQQ